MELVANEAQLHQRLGYNILPRLVFPTILRDGRKTAMPLLLDGGPRRALFMPAWEQAAASLDPALPAEVVLHGSYFAWNAGEGRTFPADLAEAVQQVAGSGSRTIRLDPELSALQFATLEAAGIGQLATAAAPTAVAHYRYPRAAVEEALRRDHREFADRARPLAATQRHGAEIVELLELEDSGFQMLDHLMAKHDIEALLITSAFHVEGISGIPEATCEQAGVAAVYVRDDTHISLLVASDWQPPGAEAAGRYPSVVDAAVALAGGRRLGYEDFALSASVFAELRERDFTLVPATRFLRRWHDRRSGGNLPFYFFAAQSAITAIRRTLDFAKQRLRLGYSLTEADMAHAYNTFVHAFSLEVGLPGSIRPYFWVLHTGERSLTPAVPIAAPITPQTKTVKMDMGTQVFDRAGRVRAASDLALTLCNTPELAAFQELLDDIILDDVIPAIRPGITGEEVHAVGVEALRRHEAQIRAWDQLPPDQGVDGYVRDCGHAMNRQSYNSISFMPGNKVTMQDHMVGCVEFVWPYKDAVIAIEHAYIVNGSRAIPITV